MRAVRSQTAVPNYYHRALRALSHRRLIREPAVSARDFARAASQSLPIQAATAFSRLTESYLAERFGGRAPADPAVDLRNLRLALRHSNKRSQSQDSGAFVDSYR
jgi:hypothetical protein